MVDFQKALTPSKEQALASLGLQLTITDAVEDTPASRWREPPLAPEQMAAVETVMSTEKPVVILTGAAGTGKSVVTRYLRDVYGMAVCATTGKAAMNIEGCTIDSMFSIDRSNWQIRSYKRLQDIMRGTPRLIGVDEASMWGRQGCDLVYRTAETFGKTLVMIGDWGQAKPVKDEWAFGSEMYRNADFIKLKECHRQSSGPYLEALNRVRLGRTSEDDALLFGSRTQIYPPDKNFDGLCIYGTRARSQAYNEMCLAEHLRETGKQAVRLIAKFEDKRPKFMRDKYAFPEDRIAKFIEDSPMANQEYFAEGSKVVFTMNEPGAEGGGYLNGDIGVLKELNGKTQTLYIEVHRDSGNFMVALGETERALKGALNESNISIKGYPVALGYGITCHKAQGMTVDRAWVDIESFTHFPEGCRHGLGYVALSRTRTLDGLNISGWLDEAFEVDEVTRPWL